MGARPSTCQVGWCGNDQRIPRRLGQVRRGRGEVRRGVRRSERTGSPGFAEGRPRRKGRRIPRVMSLPQRRIPVKLTTIALLALFTPVVAAQGPSPQERATAIKESLAQNQAALRTYSWIETTEISLKGEVKKKEQKQCSYGADGKVQKTT